MPLPKVYYHHADFDGIFSREVCLKFLPDGTEAIGWNYGEPILPFPEDGSVYVVDLCPDEVFGKGNYDPKRVVWIDHHKTAIESHDPEIPGYRIDGVAACRLCWQYFIFVNKAFLPSLQDYVDRNVDEPVAIRLAGEFDIWDKRDPNVDLFQTGLRAVPLDEEVFQYLLKIRQENHPSINTILDAGKLCDQYRKTVDENMLKASSVIEFEGMKFLAFNGRGNSLTFASKDVPETGHEALMLYFYDPRTEGFKVSLYHANFNKEPDLSEIAKRWGGGGHAGACGFQVPVATMGTILNDGVDCAQS